MRRQDIITTVCFLLILLFVYTSLSKLLSYHRFVEEMVMSPIFLKTAKSTAWTVPAVELIIAGLLLTNRTRLLGLIASTLLMTGFTIYVYYILYYNRWLPCSCGGVISAMSWKQHLWFNILFTLLAMLAAILEFKFTRRKQHSELA